MIWENKMIDEKLLALAVHFSEDSLIITDNELDSPGPHIVYVNPGFTKMTGYTPEEVIGKSPRFLQGPKTDRNQLNVLRQSLEKGEVFFGRTYNYRKDGSEFINEWHIEPIRDENNEITYFLAIQRDVTERETSRQAIEQKNIALRELLEQIEFEKKKITDNVRVNIEQVVLPIVTKLKRKGNRVDKDYLNLLEKSLNDITDSFGMSVSQQKWKLSPREIEIANLIKNGSSSKEICQILNISPKTMETHRNKIRKKLGIVKSKINLTSYLKTF